MQRDGDFLVRDSLTSIGDYVLTCCWSQKVLHFLIRKVLLQILWGHILVHSTFWRRKRLILCQHWVRSYVGNKRPLSKQSGAYIYSPVNRTLPLRYLETMCWASKCRRKQPIKLTNQTEGKPKEEGEHNCDRSFGNWADKTTKVSFMIKNCSENQSLILKVNFFIWKFHSSKNPKEMYHSFHKNINQQKHWKWREPLLTNTNW